jgi:hypothetical protein
MEETMKKLALILALLIIPCTAFGLEMLNDSSLDGITGQSGIDIAMDDIQIFMNIEKMAWIDCDGYSSLGRWACSGEGGALAMNNFQIDVLNVNAIVGSGSDETGGPFGTAGAFNNQTVGAAGMELRSASCGKIPLFYDYGTESTDVCYLNAIGTGSAGLDNYYGTYANSHSSSYFTPQFLSIDATDELPAASEGLETWYNNAWSRTAVLAKGGDSNSTVGGVLIGLPTVEIYINQLSFMPVYDGDISGNSSSAINDDSHLYSNFGNDFANFGVIQLQGITFTVLSGWIEIAPH